MTWHHANDGSHNHLVLVEGHRLGGCRAVNPEARQVEVAVFHDVTTADPWRSGRCKTLLIEVPSVEFRLPRSDEPTREFVHFDGTEGGFVLKDGTPVIRGAKVLSEVPRESDGGKP